MRRCRFGRNIDIVDALLIALHYLDLDTDNFDSTVADVDGDGGIDTVDALLVAKYYVELTNRLSCPASQSPIWSGGPYTLDGTSDYVDLPDGLTHNLSDFTIACRVYVISGTHCRTDSNTRGSWYNSQC